MNSKIKLAGLGVVVAVAAAASPYILKIEHKPDAIAASDIAPAAGGESVAPGAFTDAQKAELDGIIKDYILKNPQVLMDSVNNFRTAQEKQKTDGAVDALKQNSDYLLKGTLPDVGPKDADVTVVEFFDYNCGYCKQGYEAVQQSLDNDKKVRFIFVDFPILSESSVLASRYALAAQKQGKYFELHKEMMKFKGPKTDESILGLAKTAGLDIEKLKKDLSSPDIDATIAKNKALAEKLAINGTPGFIVGDQIIRGYIPYEGMKTLVADQRKKKG